MIKEDKQNNKSSNLPKQAKKKSHNFENQMKIEAILFLENSFISTKELSKKAECTENIIAPIIQALNKSYQLQSHAFSIIQEQDNYLLVVKQELAIKLNHLYKGTQQQKLSRALFETLAIVAYSQPITKPEIDTLRGVNSDGSIKVLLAQSLIKILGKKPIPGSPNQYGTTREFLKTFGLKSIVDLPRMKEQESNKFESCSSNRTQ